ncbi:helix-turn-helix transcriptional regulator [Fangia hongkongensis]|uniref:helix-turn-helix transcriptional regulator n=2 Tax=Fangia hongkongensis TaxID=270495 RepID=UPI0003719129|nr:hypothetical protein [Fangia hongkongensis]
MQHTVRDFDKINQAINRYTHRHSFTNLQIVRELRQYFNLNGLVLAYLTPSGRIIDISIIPHEMFEAWNSFNEKIYEPTYSYQNVLYLSKNFFSYQCMLDLLHKDDYFPVKDLLPSFSDKANYYVRPTLEGDIIRLGMISPSHIPLTYFTRQKLDHFIDRFLQYIKDKNLIEYYDFTQVVTPYSITEACKNYLTLEVAQIIKQFKQIKKQLIILIYNGIHSVNEMSEKLYRSPRTLERHLDEMRDIFACRTRYELYILIAQSPEMVSLIMLNQTS